jgi:hypothetical protein
MKTLTMSKETSILIVTPDGLPSSGGVIVFGNRAVVGIDGDDHDMASYVYAIKRTVYALTGTFPSNVELNAAEHGFEYDEDEDEPIGALCRWVNEQLGGGTLWQLVDNAA